MSPSPGANFVASRAACPGAGAALQSSNFTTPRMIVPAA